MKKFVYTMVAGVALFAMVGTAEAGKTASASGFNKSEASVGRGLRAEVVNKANADTSGKTTAGADAHGRAKASESWFGASASASGGASACAGSNC
ncbi:hypothetical protein [Aestuariivirga sp.]|uniref:hypothetical protein n=1 Tax=Aestuariivirga sp. TaxID=2650926 RepID=UPI0039E68C7B